MHSIRLQKILLAYSTRAYFLPTCMYKYTVYKACSHCIINTDSGCSMCTTTVVLYLLLSLLHQVCYCNPDANLTANYQFRQQLHERYTMYWSLDSATRTMSFAVRVQTTGWIGFGLSPNGQMPGSDVVIGWVNDNGDTFFDVRPG